MNAFAAQTRVRPADVAIQLAVVALALATGYIHSTLGGLLFTLNAIGYVVLASAQVVPLGPLGNFRWVARLALAGYAMTTIVGWAIQGPYYTTAYVAKAIEVTLISLVAVEVFRLDGGPAGIVARIKATLAIVAGLFTGRSARGAANA
ncbi:MAG TPA: hypothetical protein VIV06_10070 [Candidatus Limnocylindrales bacterium]